MTSTDNVGGQTIVDVLGRTSDAMVAVDGKLRIVGWNDAAAKLLGYTSDEALGRPCWEILDWDDRCTNSVCGDDCHASSAGAADEIIETREVIGHSSEGRKLWLNVTTIVPPAEMRGECRLVHLVREVSLPPELERLVVERIESKPPVPKGAGKLLDTLTPREKEVLTLLTEGMDGAGIAKKLVLSPATVRNHIQHILDKLDVRSRVEAVALALRNIR